MCRMMGVVGTRASAQKMAARFRIEAHAGRVGRGMAPGHRDGWGIAHVGPTGALEHAGRSTLDASADDAYLRAVARLAEGAARGAMIEHFRKATAGSISVENTHPFIEDGYAFCHNGTVRGIGAPHESDSRILFARVLAEVRKGASVEDALTTLARAVDAGFTYTSLTILVTDGRSVWGLRRIGNDPVACAADACPAEYYTLGYATLPDGSVVVSQEHEVLEISGWTPVADGEIVTVRPDGKVALHRALAPRF